MKRIWVGTAAALVLAGCHGGSGAGGGVRGRVIGMNGQPVTNAQVMLDHAGGRTTRTNSLGEFHLTSPAGAHHVLAHSAALDAAASVAVTVAANGEQNVGDVGLVDCTVILAGGATGPGDPNGGGAPDGSGDPTDPPCQIDPPPPPPDSIHYDSLTANDAFGFVDGAGIYGSGYDEGHQVGFDFYIAGDFTQGGSKTVHVDGTQAGPAAAEGSMDLYVFDPNSGWGWFYVLRTGDLTVDVTVPSTPPPPTPGPTAVPGGDPTGGNGGTGPDGTPGGCGGAVVHFDFKGENLLLDYVSWDGTAGGQVATVDEATASGDGWVFLPPPPPPGDITIADFVADWKDLYLCPGCAADGGDALYVYAFDSTDSADLSLYLPVSSLALPGTVTLDATATDAAGGMADVYDPSSGASWSYSLDHADLTSSSAAVTSGEELNLVLSAAQFDWMGSNGVVPVGGNAGGGTSPGGVIVNADQTDPPTPAELHLFITHADLSGVVDGLIVDPPPDGGNGGTTNVPLAAR